VALLAVFVVVNICCLRLRRDRVDHDHYRAPTLLPVLGIGVSLALFTTQSVRSFLLAGLLMTVFIALYLLAQLGARRHPARNRM
jgi:basic amino acid/polyamine antiporter, APA family